MLLRRQALAEARQLAQILGRKFGASKGYKVIDALHNLFQNKELGNKWCAVNGVRLAPITDNRKPKK